MTKQYRKKKFKVFDCKPCGEQSPYWSWLENHSRSPEGEILEPAIANPDVLAEIEDSPDVQAHKDALHDAWLQLTTKEKEILTLVSSGKTFDEIATMRHVSKQAIWCCFKSAKNKILKARENIYD
jgi:predicted DNA-binding protein (UPF0251 family)